MQTKTTLVGRRPGGGIWPLMTLSAPGVAAKVGRAQPKGMAKTTTVTPMAKRPSMLRRTGGWSTGYLLRII